MKNLALLLIFSFSILVNGCVSTDLKEQATIALEQGEFEKAYGLIIDGANNGDPELQHTVAMILANGYGPRLTESNKNKAIISWLKKSANNGFKDSIKWLSDSYVNGWFGLDKNIEEARRWQEKLK